jgi:hypothetical protein
MRPVVRTAVAIPVAWFSQIVAIYTLVSLHCLKGLLNGQVLGVESVRFVIAAVTAAAGAVIAIAGLTMWRRLAEPGGEGAQVLRTVAAILATILLISLFWSAAEALAMWPCRR